MTIIWSKPWQRLPFAILALALASLLLGTCVQASFAETPEEAIRRIQAGQHSPMPPPTTAPASGPAGKGMTLENGTGHILHVHFTGPASRTVVVPDGKSESVELAVGDYQVAAEVPGSRIVPFYGRQAYQPFTHYWLKFYTQRGDAAAPAAPPPAAQAPGGPRFLDDLAKLEFRVASVDIVTEARDDLKPLTGKIKFPPQPGQRLLIITLIGKAGQPSALVFKREEFGVVHRNGGKAQIFSADAIGYGLSFVWLTGPTVLIHIREPGLVTLRIAVTVPADLDDFAVRYPTLAQGRVSVPRR